MISRDQAIALAGKRNRLNQLRSHIETTISEKFDGTPLTIVLQDSEQEYFDQIEAECKAAGFTVTWEALGTKDRPGLVLS